MTKLSPKLLFHVLSLLLLFSTTISVVKADRTELPSQACTVPDLTNVCPDENVSKEKLESHCLGLHGVPAAKCYFEYLCNHHDQEAVNTHRECIEGECPLVKHVGFYNCSQHIVSYADEEEGGQYEVPVDESNNNDNTEGTVQDDKPTSGGGSDVTNDEKEDANESSSAGATSPTGPEEVIHEDVVSVTQPPAKQEEEKEEEEQDDTTAKATEAPNSNNSNNEEEGGGSKNLLGAVVLVGLGVGLLLFVFRGKVAAWAAGNHPGDGEIVNMAPAQNSDVV